MGAIFQLPIIESLSLVESLNELRTRRLRCIAAHPHVQGRTLSQADFTGDCCILFGSEGVGISPAALAACDEAVAIPMPPTVDSLELKLHIRGGRVGFEVHARVARRTDDDASVLETRLSEFNSKTQPLADYYGKMSVLRKIDGNRDREAVFGDISRLIEQSA